LIAVEEPTRVCAFCGRSSEQVWTSLTASSPDEVLIIGKYGAICSRCVEHVSESRQSGPKLTAGRPSKRGTSREWLLQIELPSQGLRDSLIADVASGVAALTSTPAVSIRGIEMVDVESGPALNLHIRTRGAISAAEAKETAQAELRQYAAALDLSGMSVEVTGRP
jgi:hypothetical protein